MAQLSVSVAKQTARRVLQAGPVLLPPARPEQLPAGPADGSGRPERDDRPAGRLDGDPAGRSLGGRLDVRDHGLGLRARLRLPGRPAPDRGLDRERQDPHPRRGPLGTGHRGQRARVQGRVRLRQHRLRGPLRPEQPAAAERDGVDGQGQGRQPPPVHDRPAEVPLPRRLRPAPVHPHVPRRPPGQPGLAARSALPVPADLGDGERGQRRRARLPRPAAHPRTGAGRGVPGRPGRRGAAHLRARRGR